MQRQKQLATQLKTIEVELDRRSGKVGEIAGVAYRTGRLGAMSALLNSDSPEGFMDRAAALDAVAANEDRVLRDLLSSKDQANRTRVALDGEITEQRKQVAVMAKRKEQAERALTVATTPKPQTSRRHRLQPGHLQRQREGRAAQLRRLLALRVVQRQRPDPGQRLHHPAHPARAQPGQGGRLHPVRLAATAPAAPANTRRAGPATSPPRRAASAGTPPAATRRTATTWPRTSSATPTGSAVLYVIWYRQIWLPSSGWKSYSGAAATRPATTPTTCTCRSTDHASQSTPVSHQDDSQASRSSGQRCPTGLRRRAYP